MMRQFTHKLRLHRQKKLLQIILVYLSVLVSQFLLYHLEFTLKYGTSTFVTQT